MIARFLLAALCAGLFVGVVITPVQYVRVIPLIMHAETYENGGGHHHHEAAGLVGAANAHEAAVEDGEGAAPTGSRFTGTLLANIVTGAGFALVLAAASLLLGVPITAASGLGWGLAGFVVVSFAPALGLAPELPAMPAAELGARQLWWAIAVGFTAAAAYCVVLRPETWAKVLGLALFAVPHWIGAPVLADLSSPVPPTLAAEFAVASLATAAFFWLLLGVGVGAAMDRFGSRPA